MATRVFLLDRSGSMETCRDDTIDGYNSFVESQKPLGGTISLYQFDYEILTVYENVPIDNVVPLTRETFEPGGSTALLDAMGHVLKLNLPRDTTVIILTDGDENSSVEYTPGHIKDLVESRQTRDGWSFVYLGANQDVVLTAKKLGIRTSIGFDTARTPELFATLSQTLSVTPTLVTTDHVAL
jgi:hypothetical protein